MPRLGTTTNSALLALFLLGATACGDDDKDKPEVNPDGGPAAGGAVADGGHGGSSGLDGGGPITHLDSGSIVMVLPDGAVVSGEPSKPQDGGTTTTPTGPDATTTAPACGGSCDDKVDCTVDRCVDNVCTHSLDNSVCTAAGSSCDLKTGCTVGTKTCSVGNATDCADTDGCTTNERCDGTVAVCKHDVLDSDGDGNPPVKCGGTDCDDSNGLIGPGGTELCDGVDNDCDGVIDDGASKSCGVGRSCVAGACACNAGLMQCGGAGVGACYDLKTDPNHCGRCNDSCGSGGVCTNGACSCPAATGTQCGMAQTCVDVKTSQTNCGMCGVDCPAMAGQGQYQACLQGACTACGAENQACCAGATVGFNQGCLQGLSCSATPGAAGAKCTCGAGSIKCGDTCTNLKTDEQHCGACGTACANNQVCLAKGDTAACVACGGVGQACCDPGFGIGICRGALACGPNDTCVRPSVGQQGNGPAAPPGMAMTPATPPGRTAAAQ